MAETVENKKQPAIRRAFLIVACIIIFLEPIPKPNVKLLYEPI
jgi:hypothetical protein